MRTVAGIGWIAAAACTGLVLLAGCPVGSDDVGDVDATGGGDGSNGTSGLTVTWGITPDVPGDLSADLEVDDFRLEISSLRVIGDSAPAGDMRTTRSPIDLRWQSGEAPETIELPTAPSGLYSRFELGVGGSEEHLTIKGEVRVGGQRRRFEIEDQRSHPVILNMSLALAPGQHTTIPVNVDLDLIMNVVPFDQLDSDDGVLKYNDNDPRLGALWLAVDTAISVPTTFIIDR